MSKKIILTGDRPTGRLHIGHFVGSLRRRVELQESGLFDKIFIMIADAQALTDNADNPEKVRQNIIEVALDYLSCGLDPAKSTIFIQSQVSELTELTFFYNNLVTVQQQEIDSINARIAGGEFGREAARKFKVLKGIEVGMEEKSRPELEKHLAENCFDQITASVHYLEDSDPYYGPYYKGKNWKEAYGRYLEAYLREMKWLGDRFDIMGHFDYITRYAPYPKESILYRDFPGLFDEILRFLAENGKAIEINTKTYKTYRMRTPQLDRDIFIRFMELGGEAIVLGSDSHDCEQVGYRFEYYAQFVKSLGFRRLAHFENRKLKMVTI